MDQAEELGLRRVPRVAAEHQGALGQLLGEAGGDVVEAADEDAQQAQAAQKGGQLVVADPGRGQACDGRRVITSASFTTSP